VLPWVQGAAAEEEESFVSASNASSLSEMVAAIQDLGL
jgi:hypothetical protein